MNTGMGRRWGAAIERCTHSTSFFASPYLAVGRPSSTLEQGEAVRGGQRRGEDAHGRLDVVHVVPCRRAALVGGAVGAGDTDAGVGRPGVDEADGRVEGVGIPRLVRHHEGRDALEIGGVAVGLEELERRVGAVGVALQHAPVELHLGFGGEVLVVAVAVLVDPVRQLELTRVDQRGVQPTRVGPGVVAVASLARGAIVGGAVVRDPPVRVEVAVVGDPVAVVVHAVAVLDAAGRDLAVRVGVRIGIGVGVRVAVGVRVRIALGVAAVVRVALLDRDVAVVVDGDVDDHVRLAIAVGVAEDDVAAGLGIALRVQQLAVAGRGGQLDEVAAVVGGRRATAVVRGGAVRDLAAAGGGVAGGLVVGPVAAAREEREEEEDQGEERVAHDDALLEDVGGEREQVEEREAVHGALLGKLGGIAL